MKFCLFVLKILIEPEILTSIKGHISVTNVPNAANNSNVDLVNINAYIKFGENLSSCSPDIEGKRKSDTNQVPEFIKGHNSVTNILENKR